MNQFNLEDFLPYRLNRVSEWVSEKFSPTYRETHQMSRWEWRTLANLGQHGNLTAKQLTKLGNMDKTKVSRAVSSLEMRKWLVRKTDEQDARKEWLSLTKKGKAIFAQLAREGTRFDEALVENLGEKEARALKANLDVLERLMER